MNFYIGDERRILGSNFDINTVSTPNVQRTFTKEKTKFARGIPHRLFKTLEDFIFSGKLPFPSSIILLNFLCTNSDPNYDKESQTLMKWGEMGLDSPEVIYSDPHRLSTIFLPNTKSLAQLVSSGELSLGIFDNFLEVYQKIRTEALRREDPELFHTDPHLGNFLYSFKTQKVIPIDPENVVNENFPLRRIDCAINLYFAYILGHEIPQEKLAQYTKKYFDSFEKGDLVEIEALNATFSDTLLGLINLRKGFAHRLAFGEFPKALYSTTRRDEIQEILSSYI